VNCGIHGNCNTLNGKCVCQGGWMGSDCNIQDLCYNINCGGHGTCYQLTGCLCDSEWSGSSCGCGLV
jgi:hypothetical protein